MQVKTMMQLSLSDSGSKELNELIVRDGAGDVGDTDLRVYVTGGGCSGFRYGMAVDKKVHEGDEVIQNNGIKVIVDGNSKEFIDGSSVDYVETVAGSGFTISNPNNWSTCGCGQSFNKKGEGAPDESGEHAHGHAHED